MTIVRNNRNEIDVLEVELKRIVSSLSRCRPGRIKLSARIIDDLGVDSFTALEILVAVEHRFGLKIAESEIIELLTFGDVVEFVRRKLSKKKIH